jgi:uncharacterized protein involved in type VI secretion and phage assembly
VPDLLHELGEQILAAGAAAGRIDEAVIGLVVDNRDPLGLGRVRLRFPVLPGLDASTWATAVALGAGDGRGWWLLPEIDDEVLVLFEHGDVGRPVVLGSLYNGVDRPPTDRATRRGFRSRGGSSLWLDDEAGTITLEDGAGAGRIVLDRAGRIRLEAPDGDVELQAPEGTLSIVARDLELSARHELVIAAGAEVVVGARGRADLRAASIQVGAARLDLDPPGGVARPLSAIRTSSGRSS